MALEHIWRQFFGRVWQAIGKILRSLVIGLLVGGLVAEITGYFIDGGWPERQFVHVAAIAFALVLGYAAAVTSALVEGVHGVLDVATQVDDVARAAVETGVNAADALVDAVDGPNRHGIR